MIIVPTPITLADHFGNVHLKSGKEVTPGHTSSFGVPITLHDKRQKHEINNKYNDRV